MHPSAYPTPFAPAPAAPKKKLSKGGLIAIIAVAAVLFVTVIANVLIAIDEERVYTESEVVSAFEDAGYVTSYGPDGDDFGDLDVALVENCASYMGIRTQNELDDEVYFIYITCTGEATAKILYDAMVVEFATVDEMEYGENWCRSAYYDEELGESVYVSLHGDAVLVLVTDYFDYVLEDAYYDDKPESVLNKVNF